jgi:hypothetical protein
MMITMRNALLFLILGSPIYGQSHEPSPVPPVPSHSLTQEEQAVLQNWLSHHTEYLTAEDGDCECADYIKQIRAGDGGVWKAEPEYHPYVATGDFNSDGQQDFAVAVINRYKREGNFALLVFNGPFQSGTILPVFVKEGLDLTYRGLFYGPPRPKPYRLIVGRFESDSGSVLVPHGRSYTLND